MSGPHELSAGYNYEFCVYLAIRHIFPEVPICAGAFDPLEIIRPENTFLDARYPAQSQGAQLVSQRIAEAVLLLLFNLFLTE